MSLDLLLGLQWGDEGKGKIVDAITSNYDIIARFQGGPNAGHTIEFDGHKHVLHTIPSIDESFFNNIFKITLFFTSTLMNPENVPSLVSKDILFIFTFIEFDIKDVILFIKPISSIPLICICALNS